MWRVNTTRKRRPSWSKRNEAAVGLCVVGLGEERGKNEAKKRATTQETAVHQRGEGDERLNRETSTGKWYSGGING